MPVELAQKPRRASYPSLNGQVAYVTGGATGIGAAIVEALVRQGCRVMFNDVDRGAAGLLCQSLVGCAEFVPVDARDAPALQASVSAWAEAEGRLDVLVNNVADDTRHRAEEMSPAHWQRCLAVNLDAAFFASRGALPALCIAGGSIINLSSINALRAPPDMPGYVTAKAGLLGLTRALARDYGRHRVRVNAVLPGWVATDRQLALWLTPEAEAAHESGKALPGRIHADDIADAVLFLASNASSCVSGQALVVDGGYL